MNKLFSDMKTDEEKSAFFLSGRGYETGVIAAAIQNDVAMAYHRCAEYKKELVALQAENERLREALEAMLEIHGVTQRYADAHIEIPQSWVDVSDLARAALAQEQEQK